MFLSRGRSLSTFTMLNSRVRYDVLVDSCDRCGSANHTGDDGYCPALNDQCQRCASYGHYEGFCNSIISSSSININNDNNCKFISSLYCGYHQEVESVYSMSFFNGKRVSCFVKVDEEETKFMVDSGATATIISLEDFRGCLKSLRPASKRLLAYTGQSIKCKGETNVMLEFDEQTVPCRVFVVDEGQSVLGMDALRALGMNIDCKAGRCWVAAVVDEVQLPPELNIYRSLFQGNLGKILGYKHLIKVKTGVIPKQQKLRRLPIEIRDKVKGMIELMCSQGVIERTAASEWISPMMIVQKKSGDLRFCVDLRDVNKAIIPNAFPLPHLDDLLLELKGASVFSKIDAMSAYFQLELAPQSRDITSFITPWGLFRFKRVPQGLSSAPAAFQEVMQNLLGDLRGVVIYLDDVLIFGTTKEEHDERLEAVLGRIVNVGMTLNSKCVFGTSVIDFVGYTISQEGVRPMLDNVKAIQNLPTPTNAAQLRSMLGAASFYIRCVPRFADRTEPLRSLLRQGVPFTWGPKQDRAFEDTKEQICKAVPLAIFDSRRETIVATDGSDYGAGAVLLQRVGDREVPVAYASCVLNPAQRRYSAGEKEAFACVFAIEKWHVYLWGRPFVLRTDHQALVALLGSSGTGRRSMRLGRWADRLRPYNYTVEYRPGVTNSVPDMLSRLPLSETFIIEGDDEDEMVVAAISQALGPLKWETIVSETAQDRELHCVRQQLLKKTRPEDVATIWRPIFNELSVVDGVILRGEQVVLPGTLRKRAIYLAHDDAHQGIVRTKQRLRRYYWWPSMDRHVLEYMDACSVCHHLDKTAKVATQPLTTTELPKGPWERVAIDIRGPDNSMPHHSRFQVVLIDYFSKWVEVMMTNDTSTRRIIEFLRTGFYREGNPFTLISDNGVQFISREFEDFLKSRDIQHVRTPVYHPQANGLVERFNRTLGGFIQTAKQIAKGDLEMRVFEMIGTYNSTPHATTLKTPSELLHGRLMRTNLTIVVPSKKKFLRGRRVGVTM